MVAMATSRPRFYMLGEEEEGGEGGREEGGGGARGMRRVCLYKKCMAGMTTLWGRGGGGVGEANRNDRRGGCYRAGRRAQGLVKLGFGMCRETG